MSQQNYKINTKAKYITWTWLKKEINLYLNPILAPPTKKNTKIFSNLLFLVLYRIYEIRKHFKTEIRTHDFPLQQLPFPNMHKFVHKGKGFSHLYNLSRFICEVATEEQQISWLHFDGKSHKNCRIEAKSWQKRNDIMKQATYSI